MQVVGGSRPVKRPRGAGHQFVGATPVGPDSFGASQDPISVPGARRGDYMNMGGPLDNSVLSHDAYQVPLSFYETPPVEEVTVEDFERAALARLRVLQTLDAARVKGLKGVELRRRIDSELRRAGLDSLKHPDDRRKDVISHFALRFAFCRVADRSWFVRQEVALFRHRLRPDSEVVNSVADFLKMNHKDEFYQPCTPEQLRAVQEDLEVVDAISAAETAKALGFTPTKRGNARNTYYRVPFEEALDMVKNRRVLLHGGFAYVPEKEFGHILASLLRAHLNRALATAYRAIQTKLVDTGEFETISPILHQLSVSYTDAESTYSADNSARRAGAVKPAEVNMLAKRSFPVCMRNLHQRLRKDHHLKHQGRMQYGLFLKGIGLDLKDALSFWRSEFVKNMPADKFDKSYAYNIRHNYGKEGKRTDYTPYSCIKIILMPVGSSEGEAHGCPFAHHGREHLRETLRSQIMDPAGVQSIIDLVQNSHYQIACRRHWELTHPDAGHEQARELVINHPNQYFDESERYYTEKDSSAQSAAAGGAAGPVKREANFLQKAQESAKAKQDMKEAMSREQQAPSSSKPYVPGSAQPASKNDGPAPKVIE